MDTFWVHGFWVPKMGSKTVPKKSGQRNEADGALHFVGGRFREPISYPKKGTDMAHFFENDFESTKTLRCFVTLQSFLNDPEKDHPRTATHPEDDLHICEKMNVLQKITNNSRRARYFPPR